MADKNKNKEKKMRFVNMSSRPAYNTFSGPIGPGETSSDGGPFRSRLEKALSEVVSACGTRLGIRLNEREAALIGKLIDLDEKGSSFTKDSLPEEVREDPLGLKKGERLEDEAQKARIEKIVDMNAATSKREAEINGEIIERKPSGPAAMQGEKVSASDLKSGFDKIMEENARIAASKPSMDVNAALDPIGANMKGSAEKKESEDADTSRSIGKDAEMPKSASGADDDATRSADAATPVPMAQNPKNAMDRQAAEMAGKLSVMSVIDNPVKQKKARGKKAK